jgi:hypothetical protein
MPPPIGSNRILGISSAAEAAVVLTVRVAVPAVVPEIVTGLGIEQVGASETVEETEQASETDPVKPPPGVTVTVEVFPVVAPRATEMEPLSLSVTVGLVAVPATVTPTLVTVFAATPVPLAVTIAVYEPGVVAEVEVMVKVAV